MSTFDVKDITSKAFAYVGAPFPTLSSGDIVNIPSLQNIIQDILNGKKYFTQLNFKHEGNEYALPNEPLISLSTKKKIIETPTVGEKRRGTVKEFITAEDFNLTFQGVCVDQQNPNVFPADQVNEVRRLFAINDAVEIVDNKFMELFGIRKIVLKELSFDSMEGQQGAQKYQIRAVSDNDFYADLSDAQEIANLLAT